MTKAQFDRLGDRLRAGSTDRQDFIALAKYRSEFATPTTALRNEIVVALKSLKARISERPAKSTQSIVAKLRRDRTRLTQMQDIGGIRIVVAKRVHQDQVVEMLLSRFSDARVVDRRLYPQYGYRAVHVIATHTGRPVEIQIRTRLQNVWAQSSEKFADKYGHEIKYGAQSHVTEQLMRLGDLLADFEAGERAREACRRTAILVMLKERYGGETNEFERDIRDEYVRLKRAVAVMRSAFESMLQRVGSEQ